MALIDRTNYNALTDDSGSNLDGTPWTKNQVKTVILDAVDTAVPGNGARCSIFHSTTQSLTNNTWTALNFDSEDFDDGTLGLHDPVTNNTRITIPTGQGGKYFVSGSTSFAANATGTRGVRILKNGTTQVSAAVIVNGNGSDPTAVQVSAHLALSAGDYVEIQAFQDSGGGLNAGNASSRYLQSQAYAYKAV